MADELNDDDEQMFYLGGTSGGTRVSVSLNDERDRVEVYIAAHAPDASDSFVSSVLMLRPTRAEAHRLAEVLSRFADECVETELTEATHSHRKAGLRANPEYDFGWFREHDGTQARLSLRPDGMLYLFHARDSSTELFGKWEQHQIEARLQELSDQTVQQVRLVFHGRSMAS